jgi:acyl-CoA thioester hydrolase
MTKPERPLFVWPVRVYFEDTDSGGVVYHARYLNFFERARTEFLRSRGVECETLRLEHRLIWVVLDVQVKFLQAAKLDDELLVSAELAWIKGIRQGFRQQMNRKKDGALMATADLSVVLLHADSLKPARMPGWLQTELSDDE